MITSAPLSSHLGVSCDSCAKTNFLDRRYKCLVCTNYDLCGHCYDSKLITLEHQQTHPIQLILTRENYALYFDEDVSKHQQLYESYTCPYCGQNGFILHKLIIHLQDHSEIKPVVCPVCQIMQQSTPIREHLERTHQNKRKQQTTRRRTVQKQKRTGLELTTASDVVSDLQDMPTSSAQDIIFTHLVTDNSLKYEQQIEIKSAFLEPKRMGTAINAGTTIRTKFVAVLPTKSTPFMPFDYDLYYFQQQKKKTISNNEKSLLRKLIKENETLTLKIVLDASKTQFVQNVVLNTLNNEKN